MKQEYQKPGLEKHEELNIVTVQAQVGGSGNFDGAGEGEGE